MDLKLLLEKRKTEIKKFTGESSSHQWVKKGDIEKMREEEYFKK